MIYLQLANRRGKAGLPFVTVVMKIKDDDRHINFKPLFRKSRQDTSYQ